MKVTNTYEKAFTLIELLIVMAIIGILATVTYTHLSGARTRAKDSSIRATMQGILIEGVFYKSENGTYDGFCADDTDTKVGELLAKVSTEASGVPTCGDIESGYGVIVELYSGEYYCVDSSKFFGVTSFATLENSTKQCKI